MQINKKGRALIAALAGIGSMAVLSSAKAASIADWSFDAGGTIAAPYNTPLASSGALAGVAQGTQLGMTNGYTFANGEGPGSIANCDVLTSAGASTGSGAYAWRVRGNGNSANSGANNANGWNSSAPIATQGAEFEASTAGYSSITVSADINVTTQAERNLAILYTLDDTASSPVWANATITSAGSQGTLSTNSSSANTISGNYVQLSSAGTGWNNLITATIPAAANSDANFAVEIVNASTGADDVNGAGAPLNNSSGNWRYDNVIVSGTAAVPEPASVGVLALGALGLAARRRRAGR